MDLKDTKGGFGCSQDSSNIRVGHSNAGIGLIRNLEAQYKVHVAGAGRNTKPGQLLVENASDRALR